MPSKAPLPRSGQYFGSWQYISELKTGFWVCKCICGVERVVRRIHLVSGKSAGCGHDLASKVSKANTLHGSSTQPDRIYSAWKNAKSRCYNPKDKKFKTYGARGITMYSLWINDFRAFKSYVGKPISENHTLGRIDNDKGYEPGNLEWQTTAKQSSNKTNSRLITYKGRTQTLTSWAQELNISQSLLSARILKLKWSTDRALATAVRHFTNNS